MGTIEPSMSMSSPKPRPPGIKLHRDKSMQALYGLVRMTSTSPTSAPSSPLLSADLPLPEARLSPMFSPLPKCRPSLLAGWKKRKLTDRSDEEGEPTPAIGRLADKKPRRMLEGLSTLSINPSSSRIV